MRIQILSTLAALILVGYVATTPVTARAETATEQAEHEGNEGRVHGQEQKRKNVR